MPEKVQKKTSLYEGVAEGLSEQIGGTPSEWKHCKGIGDIDFYGEEQKAEIHRFEESSVGKHKFKIKKNGWMIRRCLLHESKIQRKNRVSHANQ